MAPLRGWFCRWFGREISVPIAECVHFGGWRYGRGEFNPYENYAMGLARGEPVHQLRERFFTFLQHYRPADLGSALGLRLQRSYPLWLFPWSRRPAPAVWLNRPEDCPDILTHFSAAGILRWRVEEEFCWLEQTLASIRARGYQTARGAFIETRCLVAKDGSRRYLVHDGNHRISALSAMGINRVVVRIVPGATVYETQLPFWRGVTRGTFTPEDAARVFGAYQHGNHLPRTTDEPAPLLDQPRRAL